MHAMDGAAAPLELRQSTDRAATPIPQVVLQGPHAPTDQAKISHCHIAHASFVAGCAPQVAVPAAVWEAAPTQLAFRERLPPPHVALHGDQGVVAQCAASQLEAHACTAGG